MPTVNQTKPYSGGSSTSHTPAFDSGVTVGRSIVVGVLSGAAPSSVSDADGALTLIRTGANTDYGQLRWYRKEAASSITTITIAFSSGTACDAWLMEISDCGDYDAGTDFYNTDPVIELLSVNITAAEAGSLYVAFAMIGFRTCTALDGGTLIQDGNYLKLVYRVPSGSGSNRIGVEWTNPQSYVAIWGIAFSPADAPSGIAIPVALHHYRQQRMS